MGMHADRWIGVLVVGVVAVWVTGCGDKPVAAGQRWFYDLQDGQLVEYATYESAPVTLPNGHQGVTAHIYGCGDCGGETFIGKLERMDKAAPPEPGPAPTAGRSEIAADPKTTDGKVEWVDAESTEGERIETAVTQRCAAVKKRPRPCRPGD